MRQARDHCRAGCLLRVAPPPGQRARAHPHSVSMAAARPMSRDRPVTLNSVVASTMADSSKAPSRPAMERLTRPMAKPAGAGGGVRGVSKGSSAEGVWEQQRLAVSPMP